MMNEDHNRTNDVSSLLRKTERCFLRKQYSRSLILVDQYFRNENVSKIREPNRETSSSSGTANVIRLFPSIVLSQKNQKNINNDDINKNEKSFTFVATVLGYGEDSRSILSTSSSPAATNSLIVDRLAGLGLQSWHEQQRKKNTSKTAIMKGRRRRRRQNNEKHTKYHDDDIDDRWMELMEILDYYDNKDENEIGNRNKSNGIDRKLSVTLDATKTRIINSSQTNESPISLYKFRHRHGGALSTELLSTIWIPFWDYHGYERQAFMWTIQVLHYYSPSKISLLQPPPASSASASASATTIEDELWMRCVCQQLPQQSRINATLAKLILGIITEKKDYVIEGFEFELIWNAINTDDNDRDKDNNDYNTGDDVNTVRNSLIETLDGYLNDDTTTTTTTSTNINGNAHDNSLYRRHPSHRGLGVSSRTIVKARDWLLQQQHQHRDSNGKTQHNESESEKQQHNRHHRQQQQQQQNPQCRKELGDINAGILNQSHQSHSSSMTNSPPRRVLVDFLSRSIPFSFVSSIKISSSSPSLLQRPINAAILAIDAAKMIISRVVKRYIDVNDKKRKNKWISQFIQPVHSSLSPPSSSFSSSSTTTNNNHLDVELQRQRFKQIILSVVLVLIGWRRRGFLVRSGKALAWAVLAPLRELLDALELKP